MFFQKNILMLRKEQYELSIQFHEGMKPLELIIYGTEHIELFRNSRVTMHYQRISTSLESYQNIPHL